MSEEKMAYLGNENGPRESEIFDDLGQAYFGITADALAVQISHCRYAEERKEVQPVHVDEEGRPYVEFSAPKPNLPQRFILEEHDFILSGDIKTFSKDEAIRWEKRVEAK